MDVPREALALIEHDPGRSRKGSSAKHTALVQAAALALSPIPGIYLLHVRQCAARPRRNAQKTFWGVIPGCADIICAATCVFNGAAIARFVGIEAKTGKSAQSVAQRQFCANLVSVGGYYGTFRSVQTAVAHLLAAVSPGEPHATQKHLHRLIIGFKQSSGRDSRAER